MSGIHTELIKSNHFDLWLYNNFKCFQRVWKTKEIYSAYWEKVSPSALIFCYEFLKHHSRFP